MPPPPPPLGMGHNALEWYLRRKLMCVWDAYGSPVDTALYCARVREGDESVNGYQDGQ
jgi:hypothetical protein